MSLYQTLAEQTGQLILDGVLRPGERLPSVRQACRIRTAHLCAALAQLTQSGLVQKTPTGYLLAH